MLSASDMEIELAASEGRIRSAAERGLVVPDHTLTLGEKTYYYFLRERTEEIRQALACRGSTMPRSASFSSTSSPGWICPALTSRFFSWRCSTKSTITAAPRPMTLSPAFHSFYLARLRQGLPIERADDAMHQANRLSQDEVRAVMLGTAIPQVRTKEVPLIRSTGRRLSPVPTSSLATAHRGRPRNSPQPL